MEVLVGMGWEGGRWMGVRVGCPVIELPEGHSNLYQYRFDPEENQILICS